MLPKKRSEQAQRYEEEPGVGLFGPILVMHVAVDVLLGVRCDAVTFFPGLKASEFGFLGAFIAFRIHRPSVCQAAGRVSKQGL